jgi:hypothetical protein
MSNIEFDIKCIQPYFDGICPSLNVFNTLTGSGAGITDCTVGVVASGATYASVSEALAMGCRQIRIVGDLLTGPPGGTFVEPLPFDITTLGPGAPVMIYITPGVNWTLLASVLGVGGIVFTSQTLIIRGSGNESRMTLINDTGGAGSIMTAGAIPPSSLYLLDLHLLSDGNVATGSLLDSIQTVSQVTLIDCTVTATDTSGGGGAVGSGPIISVSQTAFLSNWLINGCAFVGDPTVDTTAVVMIDAFPAFGSFRLSDCDFTGDMATGTPGAVRIAGTNEAVVNNLQFGLNASPININLFNGQFSNITGRSASGGVLNVTTGGGSQISNMDIDGLLSITTAGAVLSNVNVRNAGVLAWTSPIPGGVDASNCRFNHEGMTISGAQNKFVNCDFTSTGAGTITLDVTTDANIFDNCTFAAGVPALLTLAGPNTVFSNCVIGLSLIGLGTATGCKMDTCRNSGVFITTFLGADAQVSNCNFGTSLTFAGSNSKATGCIIGGGGSIIMTAGASSGIQIANCQIDALSMVQIIVFLIAM